MLPHRQKLVKQGLEAELAGLDNHRIPAKALRREIWRDFPGACGAREENGSIVFKPLSEGKPFSCDNAYTTIVLNNSLDTLRSILIARGNISTE